MLSLEEIQTSNINLDAAKLGFEGIVAKRADAPYRSGRVQSWIKAKCVRRLVLPIIGFVPQRTNSIAAIRLGCH